MGLKTAIDTSGHYRRSAALYPRQSIGPNGGHVGFAAGALLWRGRRMLARNRPCNSNPTSPTGAVKLQEVPVAKQMRQGDDHVKIHEMSGRRRFPLRFRSKPAIFGGTSRAAVARGAAFGRTSATLPIPGGGHRPRRAVWRSHIEPAICRRTRPQSDGPRRHCTLWR